MNKKNYGVNIGSSSILMIFVLLCLVSFATLSIVSANADYKLSQKVTYRTHSYYEACNRAERYLADLDTKLIECYRTAASENEYYDSMERSVLYETDISDVQMLQVSVDILYPETGGEP